MAKAIIITTTTHEIGHNFGSGHDPTSKSECNPGSSSGVFLMYPTSNSGSDSNNRKFSPCSIGENLHVKVWVS